MKTLREFAESGNFLIAAHRGASGEAPENTIAAFKLAVEQGANMIETDIQFTNDGHIVAYHDIEHLKSGANNFNGDNSLENLKKYDIGSWFDERFSNERIPTLEETLSLLKGKAYINLEIKNDDNPFNEERLKQLIEIIRNFDMQNHVMFSSFDYKLLKLLRDIDPSVIIGVIKIPDQNKLPSVLINQTSADAVICSVLELNDEIRNDVQQNKIFLAVYSVENEEDLRFILNYNITAFGTNFPGKIGDLLTKKI